MTALIRFQRHDGNLGAGNGQTNRTIFDASHDGIGRRHRRAFGHAKAFHQIAAGDLVELLRHLDGQRRATAEARFDRTQVVLGDARVVDDRNVHRRHAGIERDMLLRENFQDVAGVARVGYDDQLTADGNAEEHPNRHAVHVKGRQRQQHFLIAWGDRCKPGVHLGCVGNEITVGQFGRFGQPRRAAGELEDRRVGGRVELHGRWLGRIAPDQVLGVEDSRPADRRFVETLGLQLLVHRFAEQSGDVIGHIGENDRLEIGVGLNLLDAIIKARERDDCLSAACLH